MVCPVWSVNWNGPPIADGAVTCRSPPSAHSISTSPTARLPAKAAIMTRGRVVRSIMKFPFAGSEAGGDAGGDHLEENRCSVVEPERQRAQHKQRAKTRRANQNSRRKPACRLQYSGQLLRR